ncbi:hypothetical protein MNB_SM-7-1226 [hydrothermal vent metagenome]|uniref:Uncharacterized protein n=1 Tax=hydrothermal vent metagenome TaxID=652676 RepID=A0A1W1BF78_9ZZZZ
MSPLPNKLDNYWLWKEVRNRLGVSNPLYKYWRDTPHIKLNNKYLFVKKHTLPQKYAYVEEILTDLSGYLPTKYAADSLHVDEHIFRYDKMRLYREFEYKYVEDIKFVNIKKFFIQNGIIVPNGAIIHLGRLKDLQITEDCTFYNLKDDYGIVIYG